MNTCRLCAYFEAQKGEGRKRVLFVLFQVIIHRKYSPSPKKQFKVYALSLKLSNTGATQSKFTTLPLVMGTSLV